MIKFAFLTRRSRIFLKAQVWSYTNSKRERLKKPVITWVNIPDGLVVCLKYLIENFHVEKLSKVSKNKFELRNLLDTLEKHFNLFFCHLNNNSYEASSNTSIIQICCGVEHCPEGIRKNKFKAFTSRVARGSHLLKNIICFVGLLHCWVILLTYKLDEIAS